MVHHWDYRQERGVNQAGGAGGTGPRDARKSRAALPCAQARSTPRRKILTLKKFFRRFRAARRVFVARRIGSCARARSTSVKGRGESAVEMLRYQPVERDLGLRSLRPGVRRARALSCQTPGLNPRRPGSTVRHRKVQTAQLSNEPTAAPVEPIENRVGGPPD